MRTVDTTELLEAIAAEHERGIYLLWSGKHSAWWMPAGAGYTTDREQAGRFSFLIAVGHVARSAYRGDPELVTRMVWTAR